MGHTTPHTIQHLRRAYQRGELDASEVLADLRRRVADHDDPAVFIGGLFPALDAVGRDERPSDGALSGVPFAVKDNIDVAGATTTAACPAFARSPDAHARAVDLLVGAGALPVAKTNMDQFATGLVGCRSPYGTPRNTFDPALVPGGSSSGSGVAVAAGLVPFALGTDTAGSGRIPAALNNVVGLKPTRGLVSSAGTVPACRSLDCVSVFTLTAADAALVLGVLDRLDPTDIYARRAVDRRRIAMRPAAEVVVGVPGDDVLSECDTWLADAFIRQVEELRSLGVTVQTVDLDPFLAAGALLYEGPWLAERHAAVGAFIDEHPADVLAVTRSIISGATRFSAEDAFRHEYRRRELQLAAAASVADVDVVAVPSVPCVPTLADVAVEPIALNARLGRFSTFVNLLDLCAVATPGGFGPDGVPTGFTLIGPPGADLLLLGLADEYQRHTDRRLGALHIDERPEAFPPDGPSGERVPIAVVGAHLSGQPLNHQLLAIGAQLVERTSTSASYRLVALADTDPPKPGLARTDDGGASIDVEVWSVPSTTLGGFVATVPHPLAIGTVELADHRWVTGFVCEPVALAAAEDITSYGGWKRYLRDRSRPMVAGS